MKPFVEKLHLDDSTSFYVRTHRTPRFEVPWHQHTELELIAFKEGYGTAFIGNYVGKFNEGDVFFLGSNLPHTFQKSHRELMVSAVVVQFEENFLGDRFLQLPESKSIKELFQTSQQGIRIAGNTRASLYRKIMEMEELTGMAKIICLADCLHLIAEQQEFNTVSTQEINKSGSRSRERIDRIYQYTIDHFNEPITLEQVAGLASMSVPAFCAYFKKSTKKTYISFLNEVRISHACKLLTDTQLPVSDICYDSGFNTLANFNKQFLKTKSKTPMQYRKLFQHNLMPL